MEYRITPLPRPDRFPLERRKERSTSTAEALTLALTRAAERAALDVVLVVDENGMLVSSSATTLDLGMLAAVTPIIGRGRALPRIRKDGEKRDMTVRPLDLDGEVLYVAAVGGEMFQRLREVKASIAATRRILA